MGRCVEDVFRCDACWKIRASTAREKHLYDSIICEKCWKKASPMEKFMMVQLASINFQLLKIREKGTSK